METSRIQTRSGRFNPEQLARKFEQLAQQIRQSRTANPPVQDHQRNSPDNPLRHRAHHHQRHHRPQPLNAERRCIMKTNVSFDSMQTLDNLLTPGVDPKDSDINGHINELTQSLANLAIMRTYDNMEDFHKLIQSVSDSIAYTLISLREIQTEYLQLAKRQQ